MKLMKIILPILLGSQLGLANPTPPKDPLWIKTTHQAFTHEYDVILHDSLLFFRKNNFTTTKIPDEWQLVDKTGLIKDMTLEDQSQIESITADGDNFVVIDKDRKIHYTKFRWINEAGEFRWLPGWFNLPVAAQVSWVFRQGQTYIPEGAISAQVSNRGLFNKYYTDLGCFTPEGKEIKRKYYAKVGVSTFKALDQNGIDILFADPWLPKGFHYKTIGPGEGSQTGRIKLVNLSVSASTLFVINEEGRMWTKLSDFDVSGQNPYFTYTFDPYDCDPKKHGLPAEPWLAQPLITAKMGQITKQITILQTGIGNDARELRVVGINSLGVKGYFYKTLREKHWHFQNADIPLEGLFLTPPASLDKPIPKRLLGPKVTQSYDLFVSSPLKETSQEKQTLKITLKHFCYHCEKQMMTFRLGESKYGKTILRLPFYTLKKLYELKGVPKLRGHLVIPRDFVLSDLSSEGRELLEVLFPDQKRVLTMKLKVAKDQSLKLKTLHGFFHNQKFRPSAT